MADTYTYGSRFICVLRGDADYERIAETIPGDTPEWDKHAGFLIKAANSHEALVEALREMESFVTIMFSRQPDGSVSDTVPTPIGPHVKLGDIMRNVRAALSTAESGK